MTFKKNDAVIFNDVLGDTPGIVLIAHKDGTSTVRFDHGGSNRLSNEDLRLAEVPAAPDVLELEVAEFAAEPTPAIPKGEAPADLSFLGLGAEPIEVDSVAVARESFKAAPENWSLRFVRDAGELARPACDCCGSASRYLHVLDHEDHATTIAICGWCDKSPGAHEAEVATRTASRDRRRFMEDGWSVTRLREHVKRHRLFAILISFDSFEQSWVYRCSNLKYQRSAVQGGYRSPESAKLAVWDLINNVSWEASPAKEIAA